ncbi:GIY-YIG nuclease family protein [Sphingomonas floccifaciens]|uniref:GIY-YIG nuclease family protein n=1 Tax=Sphingomonas floccifaciens TaxID=1844115 RepID=A0ABW4N8I9_9SPHN
MHLKTVMPDLIRHRGPRTLSPGALDADFRQHDEGGGMVCGTRKFLVYIVASQRNGTIYTGVTSNLPGRVVQHRTKAFRGFTADHDCHILV